MRIRLLSGYLDHRAGSAVYTRRIARSLHERGHEISIIALQHDDELAKFCDVYSCSYEPLQLPFLWRFSHLRHFFKAKKYIESTDFNVVDIVIASEHCFIKPYMLKYKDSPVLYFPHSVLASEEVKRFFSDPIARFINKFLYKRAQIWALDHAKATLRYSSRLVEILRSISKADTFILNPLGITIPTQSEAHVLNKDTVELLFVGSLIASKKMDVCLDALSKIPNRNWHLTIVGDGPERVKYEHQVRQSSLGEHITFVGQVEDTQKHYQQADLLLFPSVFESFGLVMLEAMACNVPVLSMDPSAPNMRLYGGDIVTHNKTGWLAKDGADFERLLSAALYNPAQLNALGKAARTHVKDHYDWDRHVDQLVADLKRLMI